MGHAILGIQGVYEYDNYISVPSSHGKVSGNKCNPRSVVYFVAMDNENIGISFPFNMLTYVVY